MRFRSKRNVVPVLIVTLEVLAAASSSLAGDVAAFSEDGMWQNVKMVPDAQLRTEPWVRPAFFQGSRLDQQVLTGALARAPMEFTKEAMEAPLEIALPMPDGTFARFMIVESPIMAPELAAKFPEIKTYAGRGVDNPAARLRMDWTPAGLHAQILSPKGAVYIDPYSKNDTSFYASYSKQDNRSMSEPFECLTESDDVIADKDTGTPAFRDTGETLRTYRLAVAATGEYTQYHGGTKTDGMAAIVTAMNRVNGVYENDFGIRMELIADNDLVVFTNPATDGYDNYDGYTMLSQNQAKLDSVIGTLNYDIGHVFSTGGGGVANLRVPCHYGWKARGVTGQGAPIGDAFYIDYVAHEMGHQFGANHTFNGVGGSCGGFNRNAATAYEPGSATTIMGYAGICGSGDDLQPHSDPYFHSASYDEVIDFLIDPTGGFCSADTATGNSPPVVDAGADFIIPALTPFVLTAVGSDPDDDRVTYCWEERDLGPAQQALDMVDNGSSPLFRSFNPTSSPSRTFPRLTDILNNTTTIGEVLPSTYRTMDFRVTIRDNFVGGGGVSWDDMQVTVRANAGPFEITSPNSPGLLTGTEVIEWDVAGTDASGIDCTNVNILLSVDAGNTFPYMLAENTPNDGSEEVTLPGVQTDFGRIKVEAVGNIFFDISDANMQIALVGPPAIPESPHGGKKNRYISFAPNNESATVAFEVSVTDGPGTTGTLGWVGEPYEGGCFYDDGTPTGLPCTGDYVARVVSAPVFRVWPEEVIHLGDCEIVPLAVYEIRATDDGVGFSPALELPTIEKPVDKYHGDIVGISIGDIYTAPQGIVNITDVQALLQCIEGMATAPHWTWCDLHGLGTGSPPNAIMNVSDLQQILKGDVGLTYLESNPDNRNPSDCP